VAPVCAGGAGSGSGGRVRGMAEFRGGMMVVVPRGRATRVFSLYVVQAGSACPA